MLPMRHGGVMFPGSSRERGGARLHPRVMVLWVLRVLVVQ